MKIGTGHSAIAIGAIVLGAAVIVGVAPRMKQREALARAQAELAGPKRVRVASARPGEPTVEITLPATSAPFRSSALYAKATGYVRKNHVDVGDRVAAGQLLAEIDAREAGDEVRLARARLEEAEANVGIAKTTADRMSRLAETGVASAQQGDDTRALANSAVAAVAMRKAELQRLEVLAGYQRVVAPFDGVITRRGTDPGALVGAQGAGGAAMFEIADAAMLRVVIDVPDAYAADVKPDVQAQVFSPRAPASKVAGKVVRTSGVLEQSSRTLRAEVHVRGDGPILPGSFVYVKLIVPRAAAAPLVPASALIVRKEGTLVARVESGKVRLVPVTVGRDLGKEVEVLEGVAAGDPVVVNAGDDLESGQAVEIVAPAKT
ncbi:MAG: efflux RND transporter periplasmic adaptor subunit [Labilithrix sp.]|nr:efflux RND transporter periplasmic adaptor subunit [Labilithrix sp.]